MIILLEKIRNFMKPVNDSHVKKLIEYLGEAPSIKTLEEVLKHYKAEVKQILGKDLLEWMNENDQTTFETEDLKVCIKTYVSAKMIDPDKGFIWLQERKYGNSIKDTLEFPKGELTAEDESKIADMGLSYIKKSGIVPASLKKIISDRLKAGWDLPEEEENGIKIGYYDECVVKEK